MYIKYMYIKATSNNITTIKISFEHFKIENKKK